MFGFTQGWVFGPVIGLAYALTFGLTAGFAFGFGQTREPSRIKVTFRGNGGPLLRRFVVGLAIGFGLTPIIGPVNGIAAMVVFTVALVAHLWLDAPPDKTTASSPTSTLKQDRGASLALGLVLALAFGPLTGLAAGPTQGLTYGPQDRLADGLITVIISATVGALMGGFLYRRPGAIAIGVAGAITGVLRLATNYNLTFLASGTAFGLSVGGIGIASRAWGAFVLARLWFALRGQLPLRLMGFLDDAHRRGILRQSGTVYQFRHERLHNYLAARPSTPRHSNRT
jgi:hypothetical protein